MDSLLTAGLAAFLLSYLVVTAIRYWAKDGRVMDIPNIRSSHTQPTPRGGGLAIVLVTLGGLSLFALREPDLMGRGTLVYMAGALFIASVGFIDDLRPLPYRFRILCHSMSALLVILVIGYLDVVTLPMVGDISFGWFGIPLTYMLIVGLINAYNFMDGIDGLASLQAVLGGFAWMVIGITLAARPTILIGLLIGASALGFLFHNWSPARIFMGDVGSTFLGFTFAVLIVAGGSVDSSLVILGLLILWPFIFDTIVTMLRRLQRGENIFEAHRSHLYQRLTINGFCHSFVALLYTGLSIAGFLLGLSWHLGLPYSDLALAIIMPLLSLGLFGFVFLTDRGTIGIEPE